MALVFFETAHKQKDTPQTAPEPVKKAYEMIRVDKLKLENPELYELTLQNEALLYEIKKDAAKKFAQKFNISFEESFALLLKED